MDCPNVSAHHKRLTFSLKPKAATTQTPSPQSKSSRQFVAAKPLILRHFRCSAVFVSILKTRVCDDLRFEPFPARCYESAVSDVTRLLNAVEHGDPKAAGELLPLVDDAPMVVRDEQNEIVAIQTKNCRWQDSELIVKALKEEQFLLKSQSEQTQLRKSFIPSTPLHRTHAQQSAASRANQAGFTKILSDLDALKSNQNKFMTKAWSF